MSSGIEYQLHASPLDSPLLRSIELVYAACFDEPAPSDFVSRVQERPGALLQLAVDEGIVVGYKLGYRRSRELFYSWLGGVLPAYQNRGIARELMARQHAWCRTQCYRAVRTDTTNAFRSMLLLNIRAGFEVVGTFHDRQRGLTIMLERVLEAGESAASR